MCTPERCPDLYVDLASVDTSPTTDASPSDTFSPPPDISPPTACASHIDCAPDQKLCSPFGFCVSPLTDLCQVFTGDLYQPDVFVIGSLLPTSAPRDALLWIAGLPVEKSIQMAVNEINQGGGLLAGRKLVHIGCDTAGDVNKARIAAAHLIDVVGAKAILGPALSSEYASVCVDVASAKGAFIMSPSATSPALSNVEDDNLCWRTAINDAAQAPALFTRLQAQVSEGVILIFATDNAYGLGLRDSLLAQPWPEDVRLVVYLYPSGSSDAARQAVVEQALSEQSEPTAAVILAGSDGSASLLETYDSAYTTKHPSFLAPRYWLTDSARYDESALLNVLERRTDLLTRVEGVSAALLLDTAPAQGFVLRYLAAYREAPSVFGPAAYDGVYAMAYAASALDMEPITGAALAQKLPSLGVLENPVVEVGPSQLVAAQIALAEAGAIDLQGASGPLRFDPVTGDRIPFLFHLWTPTRDTNNTLALTNTQTFDGVNWSPVAP